MRLRSGRIVCHITRCRSETLWAVGVAELILLAADLIGFLWELRDRGLGMHACGEQRLRSRPLSMHDSGSIRNARHSKLVTDGTTLENPGPARPMCGGGEMPWNGTEAETPGQEAGCEPDSGV